MTKETLVTKSDLGVGELRLRQRRRRQWFYYGVAVAAGLVLGLLLAFAEEGEGDFFSSDIANLSLEPGLSLALSGLCLFSFLALPLWGFSQIDEHLRQQNLIGFTGGALAALSGYPVWTLLYAGGLLPQPHAFGIFVLLFVGMIVSFAFAKVRDL